MAKEITAEQAAVITKFLMMKPVQCAICGESEHQIGNVLPSLITHYVADKPGQGEPFILSTVPVIMVTCRLCGYIRLFCGAIHGMI